MTFVKYKCNNCNKEIVVKFKVGKKPEQPVCENCNCAMNRIYKNISLGDITDDEMIHLGQKMLYS